MKMKWELIYDRNNSDPVKELIRNSSVTNFFYSLGVEISGYLTDCRCGENQSPWPAIRYTRAHCI